VIIPAKKAKIQHLLLPAVLLLLFFALALGGAKRNGPTFDEQGFLVRGLAYLRGDHRHIRVGHPLGLNGLNAALLVNDPAVALPTQDPSWQGTSFHRPAELFLWEIGNDVAHVMFLGRLPTVWLGIMLAALCGRWAWQMSGRRAAGMLALALAALDPNLIAHSGLATTDLGLAAGAALAGYTLWRFLRRPGWGRAAVAGAGFGLLMNTKYTAGLFVPLFGLVILVWLLRPEKGTRGNSGELRGTQEASGNPKSKIQNLTYLLLAYPLATFLTLWACYGFQVGVLPENLPTFSQLSGYTLPLAAYFEQLFDLGGRLQATTPSFLLGRYSDQGWWYYFPVAFLLKTPLPTLLLLGWAGVVGWRRARRGERGAWVDTAALLIPAVGYFAIALTSNINLGYRHLLPVLPFLFVFIACCVPYLVMRVVYLGSGLTQYLLRNTHYALRDPFVQSLLPNFLILWLALASLAIFPHYLTFFNVLAGGPNNGWRVLVDSNIDWGQDLGGLKQWMDENGVEQVWLSYFGEARPEYYGINYKGLDSFPPRLMNPVAQPFYPHDPAPGYYAISASNLQGVLFQNHDQFAWFREREPVAKVGYSIFIYEVAPRGAPVELALGGMQVDEIEAADYALLGTNDVRLSWFDPQQALLESNGWIALADPGALDPLLLPLFNTNFEMIAQGSDYTLYRERPDEWLLKTVVEMYRPDLSDSPCNYEDGRIVVLGTVRPAPEVAAADELIIVNLFLQDGEPQPVKMFVHLMDSNDAIVAQWDGLGVAWEGWRDNQLLLQVQRLAIPADTPADEYELRHGLYDPETLQRWCGVGTLGSVRVTNGE
jgi:hypothetical protein